MEQLIIFLKTKIKGDKVETFKKNNIQKSIMWCEKFKIPYNKFTDKTNMFLPFVKNNNYDIQEIEEMEEENDEKHEKQESEKEEEKEE
jgi:hypothetical protein